MKTTISIQTMQKSEVINITASIMPLAAKIEQGMLLIQIPHTTAVLLVCEDDMELRADLVRTANGWLASLEPFSHRKNNNPNAAAHILSAFGGFQILLPVMNGQLQIGSYQNLLLLEMDGPKNREVWVYKVC